MRSVSFKVSTVSNSGFIVFLVVLVAGQRLAHHERDQTHGVADHKAISGCRPVLDVGRLTDRNGAKAPVRIWGQRSFQVKLGSSMLQGQPCT